MSATITVLPFLIVPELVARAVSELQLIRREKENLARAENCLAQADWVFETPRGRLVGVKSRAGQPAEFLAVDTTSGDIPETLNRVKQAYARLKVLDEAKRNGYRQVKEERLADGSIRLVVQKWQ